MQPLSLVTHPDHVQLCDEFCCILSVNKLDPFICSLLSYKKYSDFSKNPSCPIRQTTHSFPTVVLASLANNMGSSPNGLCPTHREYCMLNNFWKWQKDLLEALFLPHSEKKKNLFSNQILEVTLGNDQELHIILDFVFQIECKSQRTSLSFHCDHPVQQSFWVSHWHTVKVKGSAITENKHYTLKSQN